MCMEKSKEQKDGAKGGQIEPNINPRDRCTGTIVDPDFISKLVNIYCILIKYLYIILVVHQLNLVASFDPA